MPNPSKKKLIDSIRERQQLNLGADRFADMKSQFPSEFREITEADADKAVQLKGAITLLSEQQYGDPAHALLELVQNADDLEYPRGLTPELQISILNSTISDGAMIKVWTNETGFSDADVESICRIAASTKTGDENTTGKKGVGFKSVLAISDRPQVHSNGFHFEFCRAPTDPKSTTTPIWITNPTEEVEPSGTTFLFPLRDGVAPDIFRQHISTDLILFLRTLNVIQYANELPDGDSQMLTMRRSITKGGIEIVTTATNTAQDKLPPNWQSGRHRWITEKSVLDMTGIACQERIGRLKTEVSIAIPIDQAAMPIFPAASVLSAYLPVYAANLPQAFNAPYCAQADFVLTTSREDFDHTIAWNARLLKGLGETLASAIANLHPQDRAGPWTGMKLLSLTGKSDDDSAEAIIRQHAIEVLKTTRCICTAEGRWVEPQNCFRHKDTPAWTLFEPGETLEIFETEFVHKDFSLPEPIAESLGTAKFWRKHLCEFLNDTDRLDRRRPVWFADLYAVLSTWVKKLKSTRRSNHATEFIDKLRDCCIIPLIDQPLHRPNNGESWVKSRTKKQYFFESQLAVIDPGLARLLNQKANSDAFAFAKAHLSVNSNNPVAIIDNFLIPRCKNSWDTLSPKERRGTLHFLADNYIEYKKHHTDGVPDLTPILIACDGVDNWREPADCYLGETYDGNPKVGHALDPVFEDYRVAGEYAQDHGPNDKQDHWGGFLLWLGVNDEIRIADPNGCAKTIRPGVRQLGTKNSSPSPELVAFADVATPTQRTSMLKHLVKNWTSICSKEAVLTDHAGILVSDSVNIEDWICQCADRTDHPLHQCYLDTSANRDVLGDTVTYIDLDVASSELSDDQMELLEVLGLHLSPTSTDLFRRLQQYGEAQDRTEATVDHCKAMYQTLSDMHKDGTIESSTFENADPDATPWLVLCVNPDQSWQWRPASECWWGNSKRKHLYSLLAQGTLDVYGNTMRDLFLDEYEVTKSPAVATVARALETLAAGNSTAKPETIKLATDLYQLLRKAPDLHEHHHLEPPPMIDTDVNWHTGEATPSQLIICESNDDYDFFAAANTINVVGLDAVHEPKLVKFLHDELSYETVSSASDVAVVALESGNPDNTANSHLQQSLIPLFKIIYNNHTDHSEGEKIVRAHMKRVESKGLLDYSIVSLKDLSVCYSFTKMGPPVVRTVSTWIDYESNSLYFDPKKYPTFQDALPCLARAFFELPPTLVAHLSAPPAGLLPLPADLLEELEEAISELIGDEIPDEEHHPIAIPTPREASTPASDSEAAPRVDRIEAIDDGDQAIPAASSPRAHHESPASKEGQGAEGTNRNTDSPSLAGGATNAGTPNSTTANGTPPKMEQQSSRGGGRSQSLPMDSDDETARNTQLGSLPPSSEPNSPVHKPASPPNAPGQQRPNRNKKRGQSRQKRLTSYVETNKAQVDDQILAQRAERQERNKQIDEAAIEVVLQYERSAGRSPREMPHDNEGYDIESASQAGTVVRRIEVKGTADKWGTRGVGLTAPQHRYAIEDPLISWLYVVEFVESDQPKVHAIQNWAHQIDRYYVDGGWRSLAEVHNQLPSQPTVGKEWTDKNGRTGEVLKIQKHGVLTTIKLRNQNGETFNCTTHSS